MDAELRAAEITYDFKGNPMTMNKVRIGRLPSRDATTDYAIKVT